MFDELNYFEYDTQEIENKLRQYFREMPDITDEQVEKRKNVAIDIFDLMLLFMFYVNMNEYINAYQDIDYYVDMLSRGYARISGLDEYAQIWARNIVNTTFDNKDDNYYLSQERALNVAENDANTIVNTQDYQKAVDSGKTHKTWISEKDNKVRKAHKKVNNKTIPIDKMFDLGECYMLYPHDYKNGTPNQLINCRCHIQYSTKNN